MYVSKFSPKTGLDPYCRIVFFRKKKYINLNFRSLQKRFIVPSTPDQDKIPYARVNHNKYMVTDHTAYIGTSNWSGDYFTTTAGVAFVFEDHLRPVGGFNLTTDIRKELQEVFERDWNSPYAVPLRRL